MTGAPRRVLVTGGGSGLGLAAARALTVDGWDVTLMGRSPERLEAAAAGLGPGTTWSDGSVDDEDAVARAVEVADADGTLRAAVLSAGSGASGRLLDTPLADWNAALATNLTGAFLSIKHAGRALRAHGGGSIVALSSIAGVRTHRFMAGYCAAKAGLEMLVQTAADELGEHRIRVNAVRPGLVPTDLSSGLTASDAIVDDYLAQMPLARLGTPDEVAEAVRFLVGDAASWTTGVCLSVDGGHHLRRGPWLDAARRSAG